MRTHRPIIMGRRGAVATNHPVPTQAGLDVLRQGGSAVDAAVAISLALGVAEPMMSGLGGDGFYHVFLAETGTSTVFNGSGPAPAGATRERFRQGIPIAGPDSVSVPGSLGALHAMHAAHGTRPWAGLCEAAIAAAADGFAVTHGYRRVAETNLARLRADPRSAAVFLRDEATPGLGELIVQPDLAATLRAVAEGGVEAFTAVLGAGMAEAGALPVVDDLRAFVPEVQTPIAVTYRGIEVRQTPPNSMGFTLLQELKIVEQFVLPEYGSAALVHLLVEAKKQAFMDRERHAGDPRTRPVPLEVLLSEAHAAAAAARIEGGRAAVLPVAEPERAGDTTYFCVVDAAGNAVSAIQSINSGFGSGVTAGRSGVLLNNRMAYWHLDPGHRNALIPGRRVRHTMNAPMLLRDGRLWAVLGTPGADHQVQVNLQAIVGLVDYGLDPQQVAEAPRWSSSQAGQEANWPHGGDDALTVEASFGAETLDGLQGLGHRLTVVPPLEGPCSLECIRVLDNGIRAAGSDPRRDGWAAAY